MSTLSRAEIEDILRIVDASDFDELKLEMGDLKIELRRHGAGAAPVPAVTTPAPASPASPVAAPAPAAATAGASEGTVIPAPLLGMFYHAPKPGAAPFIKIGDRVTPETVIGLIEVMKLMTSVPAGVSGVVTEIIAPNAALVEHGQPLVRVRQG